MLYSNVIVAANIGDCMSGVYTAHIDEKSPEIAKM